MSEKNRDDKNRWRNVTIAFRMSPEENEELNNRVKLSGFRTKQDYIIQSVLHQKVVATGNPLMLKEENQSLKDKLEKAYKFMKQFVLGGINLLEKFLEWIGEKVKDVKKEKR